MRFKTVETKENLETSIGYYALGIFASGFEERSIYAAKNVNIECVEKFVVLGFSSNTDVLSRKENDSFLLGKFGVPIELIEGENDDQYLYKLLDNLTITKVGAVLRILVDYSVMTRTWYAAILTWARFSEHNSGIEIDFVYSCGNYLSEFDPLSISEIECLPSFEGISGGFRSTTAIFGLGYDRYATLAVYDRLEPDTVYCCISRRTADDENAEKVMRENEVVVEAATRIIEMPLTDVAEGFRILCDHLLGLERDTHIVVVPMGPKSHVLITLLVALRLPWITCLHARGQREKPVQVVASGQVGISRVSFFD